MKNHNQPRKNNCPHQWEVAVWEYKRTPTQGIMPMTPTHTVANRLYCKLCLATKQLDERFYKESLIN